MISSLGSNDLGPVWVQFGSILDPICSIFGPKLSNMLCLPCFFQPKMFLTTFGCFSFVSANLLDACLHNYLSSPLVPIARVLSSPWCSWSAVGEPDQSSMEMIGEASGGQIGEASGGHIEPLPTGQHAISRLMKDPV